jgi:predicted nucleic acid-binding protein
LKLIVDSYAWVEFLLAGPRGPEVKRHLEEPNDLFSPGIVLVEVARRLARDDANSALISGHLRSMTALSTIVPIDSDVAIETIGAVQVLRGHSQRKKLGPPSFADAIVLAFARRLGAKVLTGDRHFEGLPETEWIGG